ncbi:nucleoporin Nup35 [Condylostylus longicornis]|uniref:nucleoporin Nup35 n=1 Tax=Condylostylus longicornis TaxID=2530218 RepID=UPI00244E076E|nr:nucleoporin Nup35 [Condylostylus longicornis]
MEPMSLGSPNNSPAAGNNPYLPSFLMGDNPSSPSPRNISSYSPKKRSLTFAQSPTSPTVTSPAPEFNRSTLGQKSIFSHNASISGPPIQGLFDSLHNEQNQIQTPIRNNYQQNQSYQYPINNQSVNQSVCNDSYLSSGSFSNSRIISPNVYEYKSPTNFLNQCQPPQNYSDFWVTVYGFPQSATSLILTHFAQCGSIVDKVFPSQNGNWVHLKFSSCLEADRALNYNEKILANNIMIGVTRCKDSNVIDKENYSENHQSTKVRPLSQLAYNSAQNESAVITSPNAPQRSTGLVNKAMDLLFGW